MHRWQLQDAKARLSELVKRAAEGEIQEITVHGKPTAVVLSTDRYGELSGKRKLRFVEFLRRSPLAGVDLEIERDPSPERPVDL